MLDSIKHFFEILAAGFIVAGFLAFVVVVLATFIQAARETERNLSASKFNREFRK